MAEALLELGSRARPSGKCWRSFRLIEDEAMAPEGLAAVAAVRESREQRKTDTKALAQVPIPPGKELRELPHPSLTTPVKGVDLSGAVLVTVCK